MSNWYYCSKCKKITKRESSNKTIKSTCMDTDKRSTLHRIDSADELAVKLRKYFLKNAIDLKSFTRKERLFLNMAFEQGAKVVFNGIK